MAELGAELWDELWEVAELPALREVGPLEVDEPFRSEGPATKIAPAIIRRTATAAASTTLLRITQGVHRERLILWDGQERIRGRPARSEGMLGPGGGGGRMVRRLVEAFRQKGATSPDKAMTAQELGLPPRFEEAMKRRLGATGIFVEVGGRYYLDEAKLKQVRDARKAGGNGWGARGTMLTIRIARMAVGVAAVLLALTNILFVRNLDLSVVVLGLLVLWMLLTVYQIFRFSRMRKRWGAQGMGQTGPS